MYLAHVLLEVLLEKRKALVVDHKYCGVLLNAARLGLYIIDYA